MRLNKSFSASWQTGQSNRSCPAVAGGGSISAESDFTVTVKDLQCGRLGRAAGRHVAADRIFATLRTPPAKTDFPAPTPQGVTRLPHGLDRLSIDQGPHHGVRLHRIADADGFAGMDEPFREDTLNRLVNNH